MQENKPIVCPNCGTVVPPRNEPAPLLGYHLCPACGCLWGPSGQVVPQFAALDAKPNKR